MTPLILQVQQAALDDKTSITDVIFDQSIEFDNIDEWAPELSATLKHHISDHLVLALTKTTPKYFEDARDLLFEHADKEKIIDDMLVWFRSKQVIGYHGTRLTDEEVKAVQDSGLLPLKASNRTERLSRILSVHPRWREVESTLPNIIELYGHNEYGGRRQDQVHLTLSAAGLTKGFNHYLTHGSEFDQCVANHILGPNGKELLKQAGHPRLIHVNIPGAIALDAAHPYFKIEDLRSRGEVPNLIKNFLEAWCYRLAHPDFQSRDLRIDSGMTFWSTIPSHWLVKINTLTEEDLTKA